MHSSNIAGLADALNRIEARLDALEQNPVRLVDGLGTRIEQSGTDYAVHAEPSQILSTQSHPWQLITRKTSAGASEYRVHSYSKVTSLVLQQDYPVANVGQWNECNGATGSTQEQCETAGGKWELKFPWQTLSLSDVGDDLVVLEIAYQDGFADEDAYSFDNAALADWYPASTYTHAYAKIKLLGQQELDSNEGSTGYYELYSGGTAADGYDLKYVRIPIANVTIADQNSQPVITSVTQIQKNHIKLYPVGLDAVPGEYTIV